MNDAGAKEGDVLEVSSGLLLVLFANGAGSGKGDNLHDDKSVRGDLVVWLFGFALLFELYL